MKMMFKNIHIFFVIFSLTSCITPSSIPESVDTSFDEDLSLFEDEDEDLDGDDLGDGFEQELKQEGEISVAQEKEAEGELEEIEDEFAKFIEEEEEEEISIDEDLSKEQIAQEEEENEDIEDEFTDIDEEIIAEGNEDAEDEFIDIDEEIIAEGNEDEILDIEETLKDPQVTEEVTAQTTEDGKQEEQINEIDKELLSSDETLEETKELENLLAETDITENSQAEDLAQSKLDEDIQLEISLEDESSIEDITKDESIKESIVQKEEKLKITITDIRYEDENIYIDSIGGQLSYRSRFNKSTKQFIIEIPNATIVSQLKWPYIMKEFHSHFALLQADQKTDDTVRIIIQMKPNGDAPLLVEKENGSGIIISSTTTDITGGFPVIPEDPTLAQEDLEEGTESPSADLPSEEESLEASLSPENDSSQILQAKTIEEFLLGEHKFYGNKVTLDIRDAEVKDILYFLLEETGLNMIISDEIPSSKISIHLKEVPWDQALIFIMRHKKLGYTRKGNIIYISTLNEFKQEQTELTNLIAARETLTPLKMEIIPISYVQASTLQNQIQIFSSPRGRINVDQNNNALIVYDTNRALEDMKRLITDLDRTPKQVMISAKIVEVTESFTRNFGITWGLSGSPWDINAFGTNIEFAPNPFLNVLPGSPDTGTAGTSFNVASFPYIGDLDAQLGLAETEGTVKVLSSPRIMALNNESATVNQSTESISFSAILSESGATQTQINRSPVTLSLSVTPQITNVNSIYMTVSMTRSFEGPQVGQDQSSARPTNSRSANTRILITSGQTAVIGGIYETQDSKSLLGIPFLKYIPFIKWFFSKTNTLSSKTELLLFLTPQIVDIQSNYEPSSVKSAYRKKKI